MISLFNLFLIASCLGMTHGEMVCEFKTGETSVFDRIGQIAKTCPQPVIGDPNKGYCCVNSDGSFHCCDFMEFAFLYLIIAAVVFVVVSILISIICCFCCSCCFCYKRRHGTVIHVPPTVVQHTYYPPAGQNAAIQYNAYSAPYTQQPAYNPSYS